MSGRKKYSFSAQTEAKGGRTSFGLAIASFVLFASMSMVSFAAGGNGDIAIGAAGFLGITLAAYGLILGVRGLAVRNARHTFSLLGSIGCAVMALVWLTLFLLGVKL